MALSIRCYYHLYAAGEWRQPAAEYLTALAESGMRAELTIGFVGSPEQRAAAAAMVTAMLHEVGGKRIETAPGMSADTGWEQMTLTRIHRDVHEIPGEFAVLYCHTKGAANSYPSQDRWRQAMTTALVTGWEKCTALLEAGCDQVGPHRYERLNDEQELVPFWGGNFWWAKASYLRTLAEPGMKNRYAAETWVRPRERYYDVLPGPVNY